METGEQPPPEPGPQANVRAMFVTYLGLLAVMVGVLVVLLSPFLVSLSVGVVLSVLFQPLYDRLRRRLPKWASALIITLGVVVLILGPVALMVGGAFRQGSEALGQIGEKGIPTMGEGVAMVRKWVPFLDVIGSPEEIEAYLQDALGAASKSVSNFALAQLQALPQAMLQLALTVLSMYFFLVDGGRLFRWIAGKLPISVEIRNRLASSFHSATNAVVLASVAAAGVQALLLVVAFWALGVPAALLAGGIAFALAWIPSVGTVPVSAAAALYLFVEDSTTKAIIMVVAGGLIALADNVVRPMVLRGKEEMHPMVGLLAILGGIVFLGLPGVFLGPLLASMAIAVLEIWPSVASFSGVPVTGAGDPVPEVPILKEGKEVK